MNLVPLWPRRVLLTPMADHVRPFSASSSSSFSSFTNLEARKPVLVTTSTSSPPRAGHWKLDQGSLCHKLYLSPPSPRWGMATAAPASVQEVTSSWELPAPSHNIVPCLVLTASHATHVTHSAENQQWRCHDESRHLGLLVSHHIHWTPLFTIQLLGFQASTPSNGLTIIFEIICHCVKHDLKKISHCPTHDKNQLFVSSPGHPDI